MAIGDNEKGMSIKDMIDAGLLKMSDLIQQIQEDRKAAKNKPKSLRIDEHIDLENADKLERQRRKDAPKPYEGSTDQLPDGWSTAGKVEKPKR